MSALRLIDLQFFAAGGASVFALLGYGAAPMRTETVETHLDLRFSVRRERVRFLRRRRFVRACDCRGEPDDLVTAYLMPAIEAGFVVDTVAWHPKTDRIASENGRVAMLGRDALDSPTRVHDPLTVAPDPRVWLAGFREGVCLVDEDLARPLLLDARRPLLASSVEHGEALDAMLRKVSLPSILVPDTTAGKVAA